MDTALWIAIFGLWATIAMADERLFSPPALDLDTSIDEVTRQKLMNLPGQKDCGISGSKTGRIVGGEPAKLGAWPWAIAFGQRQRGPASSSIFFFCGASLISNRHAISAAHCVADLYGHEELVLRIGDLELKPDIADGASPVTIGVAKYQIHKDYTQAWFGYDFALLTMKEEVKFTDTIRPICLPTKDIFYKQDFDGYQPFVVGWGLLSEGGAASTKLMQVQLPLIPRDECTELLGVSINLHDDGICALGDGKDSCQGDSGGPLMLPLDDGKYYLYGLVSYGAGCARPGLPGIYNKVHTHMKWIANHL